jgi:hypothetical protein
MAGLAIGFALAAALTFRGDNPAGSWIAVGLLAVASAVALLLRHRHGRFRSWDHAGDEQALLHRQLEADARASRRRSREPAMPHESRSLH